MFFHTRFNSQFRCVDPMSLEVWLYAVSDLRVRFGLHRLKYYSRSMWFIVHTERLLLRNQGYCLSV